MANISSCQSNYEESIELLEHARRVALKNGYYNELRRILCLSGIARGNATFNSHADMIIENLRNNNCSA